MKRKLGAFGAVLIRGAKACGKTESAIQMAKNILKEDRDIQVSALMNIVPQRIGETPRQIDEWQELPKLGEYFYDKE